MNVFCCIEMCLWSLLTIWLRGREYEFAKTCFCIFDTFMLQFAKNKIFLVDFVLYDGLVFVIAKGKHYVCIIIECLASGSATVCVHVLVKRGGNRCVVSE